MDWYSIELNFYRKEDKRYLKKDCELPDQGRFSAETENFR